MNLEDIKDIAKKKGVDITELSAKIGMTPSGLYQAMKRNSIETSKLKKIANVLNVPIEIFFSENDLSEDAKENLLAEYSSEVKITGKQDLLKIIAEKDAEISRLKDKVIELLEKK